MIRSALSICGLLCCLAVIEYRWNSQGNQSPAELSLAASVVVPEVSSECPGAPAQPATLLAVRVPGFEYEASPVARQEVLFCSAESDSLNRNAQRAHGIGPEASSRSVSRPPHFLTFGVSAPADSKKKPAAAPPVKPADAPLKSAKSDSSESEETEEPARVIPLTPEMAALRAKIHRALDLYRHSYLNTQRHSPWEIMHSMIAWGVDTKILKGGPSGEPVTAVGWLCFNGRGNGLNLFYLSGDGIAARNGPGLQGHDGQFLAMLAQSRLKEDYPLKVSGKEFTIADLIKYEQKKCRRRTELTFKLIGMMHYLPSDATWENESGEPWSIPKLISEEISQPIRGATCGGTHRLYSLAYAVKKRAKRGEPIDGEYARAAKFITDYQAYTLRLQNPDGSFSTEWFRGRGNRNDVERKMQTTGHILELMAFSLPQDKLDSPRIVKAVDFLAGILIEGRRRRWKVGPLGHALHSLVIYDQRVFESAAPEHPARVVADDSEFRVAQKKTRGPNPIIELVEPRRAPVSPTDGPSLTLP